MALRIAMLVEGMFASPRGIVRDDRDSAFVSDSLAQAVTVVGCIGQYGFGWQAFDQRIGLRGVSFLASREREAHRAPKASYGHVDLGAQAAARTAQCLVGRGLIFSPLFAPEACWWARMMVESTIKYSKSGSSDIAAKMRHQMPLWLQRLKRRKTLFQSPNAGQIAPGRTRSYDPQHCFNEHAIVATRRTARPLVANKMRRYPLPLIVAKDQTIQDTHGCLQKTALNLICTLSGIPRVHTS